MAQFNNPISMNTGMHQPPRVIMASPDKHQASKLSSAFVAVGVIQVIAGIACSVVLGLFSFSYVLGGIWYVVTGGLALGTSASPTRCNVITGMVFSILAAISAASSAIAALWYLSMNPEFSLFLFLFTNYQRSLLIVLCVLFAVEAIAAIVHSALCCSGTSCASQYQPGVAMQTTHVINVPVMGNVTHGTGMTYDQNMYNNYPNQPMEKHLL